MPSVIQSDMYAAFAPVVAPSANSKQILAEEIKSLCRKICAVAFLHSTMSYLHPISGQQCMRRTP